MPPGLLVRMPDSSEKRGPIRAPRAAGPAHAGRSDDDKHARNPASALMAGDVTAEALAERLSPRRWRRRRARGAGPSPGSMPSARARWRAPPTCCARQPSSLAARKPADLDQGPVRRRRRDDMRRQRRARRCAARHGLGADRRAAGRGRRRSGGAHQHDRVRLLRPRPQPPLRHAAQPVRSARQPAASPAGPPRERRFP